MYAFSVLGIFFVAVDLYRFLIMNRQVIIYDKFRDSKMNFYIFRTNDFRAIRNGRICVLAQINGSKSVYE